MMNDASNEDKDRKWTLKGAKGAYPLNSVQIWFLLWKDRWLG